MIGGVPRLQSGRFGEMENGFIAPSLVSQEKSEVGVCGPEKRIEL